MLTETHYVIIRIDTDEDIFGIGEVSGLHPSYHYETPESVTHIIKRYVEPRLIGEEPLDIKKISIKINETVVGNRYAKNAINMALYDILGKYLKTPISRLLGGSLRERISGSSTISIMSSEDAAEEAVKSVEEGFKYLKLKVGGKTETDPVQRVKSVREAVGNEIIIGCDPNQSWNVRKAIRILKKMEKYDLAFVEQPLPKWDINGLSKVAKEVDASVVVDESLHTPKDAMELIRRDAADFFCIKMVKVGGFDAAKEIAAIAESANLPCNLGAMGELGIASAAGAQLASTINNLSFGCEFVQKISRTQEDLIVEPLKFEDGYLYVPKGPGLGVELDEEEMKKYVHRS